MAKPSREALIEAEGQPAKEAAYYLVTEDALCEYGDGRGMTREELIHLLSGYSVDDLVRSGFVVLRAVQPVIRAVGGFTLEE